MMYVVDILRCAAYLETGISRLNGMILTDISELEELQLNNLINA